MYYKIIVVTQSIISKFNITIIAIYILLFLLIFKIFCITTQSINELCVIIFENIMVYMYYIYIYTDAFKSFMSFSLINFDVF